MLRLLLVIIWILIIMVILGIPALLIFGLIGLFDRDLEHRLAQRYVLVIVGGITFLAGEKIIPLGLENIPEGEGVLFISNHRSLFDIFSAYRFFKGPTSCISKIEWKRIPILRQFMDTIRTVYLDRSNVRAGLKSTAEAEELLKKEVSIWVCPEGTRSQKPDLLPFHEGSFRAAFQTGRRIVPFTLTHTDDLFEQHKPWIRPATVTIAFGKPIETAGLNKEERKALIADVARQIQESYNTLQ
ncbi:MAG: 1-acyl-sn-glycerol-3-phosphate acyltransferase [Lachnospiraceae bacterium]|nr:1-acyl-sn-glycerol-3-phosphate acyltransferase [Lachnospiraceae bacterium]